MSYSIGSICPLHRISLRELDECPKCKEIRMLEASARELKDESKNSHQNCSKEN